MNSLRSILQLETATGKKPEHTEWGVLINVEILSTDYSGEMHQELVISVVSVFIRQSDPINVPAIEKVRRYNVCLLSYGKHKDK